MQRERCPRSLRVNGPKGVDFLSANIVLETVFLATAIDHNDEPTVVWPMEFRDRPAFRDDAADQDVLQCPECR